MKRHLFVFTLWVFLSCCLFVISGCNDSELKAEERIVRGNSMSPLLKAASTVQVIFGYYQDRPIKRGDIVVLHHPGHSAPLIKHVMGIPGDKFELRESTGGYSLIVLNGKILRNSRGKKYKLSGPEKSHAFII